MPWAYLGGSCVPNTWCPRGDPGSQWDVVTLVAGWPMGGSPLSALCPLGRGVHALPPVEWWCGARVLVEVCCMTLTRHNVTNCDSASSGGCGHQLVLNKCHGSKSLTSCLSAGLDGLDGYILVYWRNIANKVCFDLTVKSWSGHIHPYSHLCIRKLTFSWI